MKQFGQGRPGRDEKCRNSKVAGQVIPPSFLRRKKVRKLFDVIVLGFFAALLIVVAARKPVTHRPPIIGIAHIALITDNLAAAREFYGHPFAPPGAGCSKY